MGPQHSNSDLKDIFPMQGLASTSDKTCSWCGTVKSATANACSKCGAVFSSIQQPFETPIAGPSAGNQEQSERARTPDYDAANAAEDGSMFDRMSLDAMNSLGLGPAFVSGQGVAFVIAAGLSVYVLISLAGAILDISQIESLSNTPRGLRMPSIELTASEAATLLIRVLLIGIAMVTGVFFLIWIYRAHKNLRALGATDLKYSPGWAIGGFFIPVLNVVRPYQVVTEIWKASGPGARRSGGASWIYESPPVFISLWWGLWLLSGFLDFISVVMVFGAGQADQLVVASRYRIVYYLTSVACAALAIAVVLKINARQENANRMNFSTESGKLAVPEIASDQL
jgi:hypothetical protein